MVLLEAIGLASKELFDYNRENYKFDQEQRLERDLQRVEMQIARFDLFREDIEDLVKLTVDKMDMYHLVGALFLGFTALIYCEGLISGPQPPFFMSIYLLSTAASFAYLLLAVWLSMYASIASHSFGVRLRTRYVRLPIPSLAQIASLTARLSDFEKQGVSKMMRLPFGAQGPQSWELHERTEASSSAQRQGSGGVGAASTGQGLPESQLGGGGDIGFGREDVLLKASVTLPGRHVQLFRKLQAKWQCYDAYARVSMALGVNQLIQSVNYFVVGVTMIEKCSPCCGYAATIIFQCAASGLIFLDVSGLSVRAIILVQVLSALPVFIVVGMLTTANIGRGPEEPVDLYAHSFYAAPAALYLEAIFLEVFLWISTPSKDEAHLPRKFRMILFLDVFGDAAYDPTEAEHAVAPAAVTGDAEHGSQDSRLRELLQQKAAVAMSALNSGQSALRRWEAIPQDVLDFRQLDHLRKLRQEYSIWRQAFHGYRAQEKSRRQVPYDAASIDARDLRSWSDLTAMEKREEEFAEDLLGPLRGRQGRDSYYDLEPGRMLWELAPGKHVLTLSDATSLVQRVEDAVRSLLSDSEASPGHDGDASHTSHRGEEVETDMTGNFRKKKRTSPERLPWKSLKRLTRVIQVCWLFLGTQQLFQEFELWTASYMFGSDRRRLSIREASKRSLDQAHLGTYPSSFVALNVSWPHGAFFRPASMSCPVGLRESPADAGADDEQVVVSSAFVQYRLKAPCEDSATCGDGMLRRGSSANSSATSARLKLAPLPLTAFPVGAVVVHCSRASLASAEGTCLLAALRPGGKALALWQYQPGRPLTEALQLPIEGRAWLDLAGAVLPCVQTRRLQPAALEAEAEFCLVLAGWDGERIPLAAVQLASTSFDPSVLLPSSASIAPRMEAPLPATEVDDGKFRPEASMKPLALHLSGAVEGGRLWAVLPGGQLQVWDLSKLRSVGRWDIRWPVGSSQGFQATGICERAKGSFLLAGLDADGRPQLLEAALPF